MKVYKFGGASVKNAAAVKNVGDILMKFGSNELLIVVSAMGKTTNALEQLAKAYLNNHPNKGQIYSEIKKFHDDIISELIQGKQNHAYDDIENLFIELECELEMEPASDADLVYDQIVSYGEIFSTRIVSTYLNEVGCKNRWIDARNFIATDNTYRDAKVDWDLTQKLIHQKLNPIVKKQMVITQGFIGKNNDNLTTTLGREGSDYSAAIFANCLNAKELTIWKDVSGVMNADPKLFPDAIKIENLSYPRAIEMAFYGATIIHPKTIQPLQQKQIPLFVKSFINPDATGTCVGVEIEQEDAVPAYILKKDQTLLSIKCKDFSFMSEDRLSDLFALFNQFQIKVNLMQNSAISFSVCINQHETRVQELMLALALHYEIKVNQFVELFTISFAKNNSIPEYVAAQKVLLEQKTRNTVQWVITANHAQS